MIKTGGRPGTDKLVEAAMQTARGMRAVAEGKPADHATQSDARSFNGIARLLELLVNEIDHHRALADTRREALARIAELKIRGGAQLVESGRWQRIAGELREIAGETLAAETPSGVRPDPGIDSGLDPVGSGENRRS